MTTDELRDLLALSMPGPFEVRRYAHGGGRVHVGDSLIADFYGQGNREYWIAAATELPALLDRLEAAEKVVAAVRTFLTTADGAAHSSFPGYGAIGQQKRDEVKVRRTK